MDNLLLWQSDTDDSDTDSSLWKSPVSSTSSDTDGEKPSGAILGYVDKIVSRYSDKEFISHFRLSRATVDIVLNKIKVLYEESKRTFPGGKREIPLYNSVLMTLWYVANTESFRQIGDRFGVARGTACTVIHRLVDIMFTSLKDLIQWFDAEKIELSQGFFAEKGMPRVIGAVD